MNKLIYYQPKPEDVEKYPFELDEVEVVGKAPSSEVMWNNYKRRVNDYALQNPTLMFENNPNTASARRHLSDDTWKEVIRANGLTDPADPRWRMAPEKFRSKAMEKSTSKAMNDFAPYALGIGLAPAAFATAMFAAPAIAGTAASWGSTASKALPYLWKGAQAYGTASLTNDVVGDLSTGNYTDLAASLPWFLLPGGKYVKNSKGFIKPAWDFIKKVYSIPLVKWTINGAGAYGTYKAYKKFTEKPDVTQNYDSGLYGTAGKLILSKPTIDGNTTVGDSIRQANPEHTYEYYKQYETPQQTLELTQEQIDSLLRANGY